MTDSFESQPFKFYDEAFNRGRITLDLPEFINNNINPEFKLRKYQKKVLAFFLEYYEKDREKPTQLLFHMATGSGKTLMMAALILYLYNEGYRNFVFFVNNKNILKKTQANFLETGSSKYLFSDKIIFDGKEVEIKSVDNFDYVSLEDINIHFTTIQRLHSRLNAPRENSVSFEDFKDKEVVLISDEAHHLNTLTRSRSRLSQGEKAHLNYWEGTVNKVFNSNHNNMLLEFTATAPLDNEDVKNKYENKILFQYSLKEFRLDGYSKEVKVLEADLDPIDRAMQTLIISQYRRKVAEKNKIFLKPVILMKSKNISDSKDFKEIFHAKINNLNEDDINKIKTNYAPEIVNNAFKYFEESEIDIHNLILELKEEFAEEKCLSINSTDESKEKQLIVNSLEDKNNEIRVIFAVDKLNEGWDVLNLFDIVRLYETQAASRGVSKTTTQEAQLIGRGARYFPFQLDTTDNKYMRKFDEDLENELRVLEELYYHSSHNPSYIRELHNALVEYGIVPSVKQEKDLIVKETFKESRFWENGLIYLNEKIPNKRENIRSLNDYQISNLFNYKLFTGKSSEYAILDDISNLDGETVTTILNFKDVGANIIRKAINVNNFYYFSNLKKYFPHLSSISEFIISDSYLAQIEVEVNGVADQVNNLNSKEKLEIVSYVLKKIVKKIKNNTTEYVGGKKFLPHPISTRIKDKKIKIIVNTEGDSQIGVGMGETTNLDLHMDLSNKDWYVYNENYGTSEEKYLTKFVNNYIEKLEQNYEDIYLIRNERLFKIYQFSDGAAFEPDFVLFLKDRKSQMPVSFQLFIEPKGEHLLLKDKWKEDFLKEIEQQYQLYTLHQDNDIKIIGMPFYTENRKIEFREKFEEKLFN